MLPIASDTLLQQRYRILNVISEGEFARTYLATDSLREDADCAIEELVPSTEFPNTVARAKELFKQEAALLSQLDHAQLPHFGETFEERDRLFLVRDYIPGKTYGDLLAARRDLGTNFSQGEVWQFLVQILPVLGSIHSQGAIHRNISPDSIICREGDGLPVPIDFGVVGEFAQKLQISPLDRGIGAGQPGYAPSEQIQSRRVFPNTDLYALAVTAIVMLTSKDASALVADGRINGDWRKWTQIDDRFANILEKMLAEHPTDRYQSALDVYQDLQHLQLAPQSTADTTKPPLEAPTVVVGEKVASVNASENANTSLSALSMKSMWEKPQVFIPLGVLLSLLIGTASFLGFKQIFQNRSTPVATTPPKQIDFNNPTIPHDTSTTETSNETIEPVTDKEIVRAGKVDPNNTMRYRLNATGGQYLDIKLVAPAQGTAATATTAIPTPIAAISPTPTTSPTASSTPGSKDNSKNTATTPPIAVPGTTPRSSGNQVLMSLLAPTGNAVDASADRVVGWRGQIPTTGEYTIELRPIKGLSGQSFPYKLSVTQLASLPSAAPTADPDLSPTPAPSVDGSSTINSPANIDGTQTATPSSAPTTTTVTPSSGIVPVPIVVPTNNPEPTPSATPSPSERTSTNNNSDETPRRRRRRRQIESNTETTRQSSAETTPRRRRRTRVDSSEETTSRRRSTQVDSSEETPTPRRRRRAQVESSEATPTSRRRRVTSEEKQIAPKLPSTPANTSESGNKTTNTPQPEPSVGIPVPPAKNTIPPAKTEGGTNNDTE